MTHFFLSRGRMLLRSMAMLLLLNQPAAAITLGQVDNFQGGTVQGWSSLGQTTTSNVANAGPAGAGDNALDVVATNRVTVFNETQWVGNYTAAGVNRITMAVRHQNAFNLQLRLGIAKGNFSGGGFGDTYVSVNSVTVPNDGVWHNLAFDVKPSDFEPSAGNSSANPNAAAALANVTHLRILHNPSPMDFTGAPGGGVFRVDNITAAAATVESADFDGDNDIDGADFLTWQRGLGVGTTKAQGDADGNNMVNAADLAVWKSQFGLGAAAESVSAVPEPGALVIGSVVALAIVGTPRRSAPKGHSRFNFPRASFKAPRRCEAKTLAEWRNGGAAGTCHETLNHLWLKPGENAFGRL
jgi:hypothetical protein